jgi:hypothetical protein
MIFYQLILIIKIRLLAEVHLFLEEKFHYFLHFSLEVLELLILGKRESIKDLNNNLEISNSTELC